MELNTDFKFFVLFSSIIATIGYVWLLYRVVLRKKISLKSDFTKIFPALITVMAAMLSLFFFFIQSKEKSTFFQIRNTTDNKEIIEKLGSKVQKLEAQILKIESLAKPVKDINVGSPDVSVFQKSIEGLKQSISENSLAIEKYNDLLLTKPEQLITLPLLQKDIKVIKDDITTVKGQVTDLRVLLSETAGQNRWVIGTLALGMLTLVVPVIKSVFSSSSKKEN